MVLFVDTMPLVVTNNCPETVWPAIFTSANAGPDTGGFELASGTNRSLEVGPSWVGRVWGRTNCTFTDDGTAVNTTTNVACDTGDCGGQLDCTYNTGSFATLAEFTLAGGVSNNQNFYDISLVDGYNLPVGIVYVPSTETSFIPPNLVNPTCIATKGYLDDKARTGTIYTNSTFPTPWEDSYSNSNVGHWCPYSLQTSSEVIMPGNGIYPYPDDGLIRPVFDPCISACSNTGSDADCCKGKHATSDKCRPSLYSRHAKKVCPDAYSYAYDDSTSTFIIPQGGGWEVVFCPAGRSTDILKTFGSQLSSLAASGTVTSEVLADVKNVTYINTHGSSAASWRTASLLNKKGLLCAAVVLSVSGLMPGF